MSLPADAAGAEPMSAQAAMSVVVSLVSIAFLLFLLVIILGALEPEARRDGKRKGPPGHTLPDGPSPTLPPRSMKAAGRSSAFRLGCRRTGSTRARSRFPRTDRPSSARPSTVATRPQARCSTWLRPWIVLATTWPPALLGALLAPADIPWRRADRRRGHERPVSDRV